MPVDLLSAESAARLRSQPLTYTGTGTSLGAPLPGYRHVIATHRVQSDRGFDELAHDVLTWQVQARSGLKVSASTPGAEPDSVVVLRLGFGRVGLTIPCRVVAVVDEPDRKGFAYGTLPGHPESGEEAFVVVRHPDETIDFTITSVSRPASWFVKLGGPVSAAAQRLMTNRYLRTLDHP